MHKDTQSPLVTTVIVNWNKKNDVLNLINSLVEIHYSNFQIVVVDNASTDGSADAIKKLPFPLTLIENTENLGGTGGFNTGIRFSINSLEQDYIWLLDNDAEVTKETLQELVTAAEEDATIGVAGSCMLSPDDPDLLVEAGAFVDWETGTWKHNLRYRKWSEVSEKKIVQVDYVAACSALVRSSIAKKLNGMDDRYFLHWDDIDFCLRIKDIGYKCVSVLSSKVYHGAENGFNPQGIYYDFRNSLITASKHLKGAKKTRAYGAICFNAFAVMALEWLMDRKDLSRLAFSSISDFITGRYGKAPFGVTGDNKNILKPVDTNVVRKCLGNTIVFSDGAYNEITHLFQYLRDLSPTAKLTFSVSSSRRELFQSVRPDDFHFVDNLKDPIFKKTINVFKTLISRFDCGISCESKSVNPYVFMVNKHYVYNAQDKQFYLSERSLGSLWKVACAAICGILGAIAWLPVVWFAGMREKQPHKIRTLL
nr:glycosyltransferase family 2 protein [uncultured Desulfobacter sp.]